MSSSAEVRWRRFKARKRAEGLKRIQLWVREEDVEALQAAARQPFALARLREEVEAELRAEVWESLEERLKRVRAEATRARRNALLDEVMGLVTEAVGSDLQDTEKGNPK